MEKTIDIAIDTFNEYMNFIKNSGIFLGEGRDGQCYHIEPNNVIKFYKHDYNQKKYSTLMKYINDSVLFPNFAFIVDGKVKAAMRPYVSGKTLNNFDNYGNDIDFDVIIKAFTKLKSDLTELSKDKILVNDIMWGNIVWDGNYFKIIDTLHYKKSILSRNLIETLNAQSIYDSISNWLIEPNLYSFLMKTECDKYLTLPEFLRNPDEMIYQIKIYLETYLQTKVSTFGESSKILALKKH